MKICHLIMVFRIGGSETMLVDIINEQSVNNEVSLIIMNKDNDNNLIKTLNKNIRIYFVNRPRSSVNPYYILKLNLLIWKIKPDVLHLQNLTFIKAIFYSNKKIFGTAHAMNYDFSKYRKIKSINKIFAISNIQKQELENKFPSFQNIITVENAIDINKIKIKEFNTITKFFKLIQVSRLDHVNKGQDILIEALNVIVNIKKITNISLDFIGEGESYNFLKELVHKMNLYNYINFLGIKDRNYVYNHLCDYDILVQPSRHEGFGLTVVEGMAAGLLVLVSDSGGPKEIIKYGKYGKIFENENVYDCANKIIEMIQYTEIEKFDIILKSKIRAQDYSIKKQIEKYNFYYLNKLK